jgi:hypothetical protein
MLIEKQNTRFEASRDFGGTSYDMELTADSAAVVTSKIYSQHRIPEAVIRELSCNAQDSHIAAGKPGEPIEVSLPTEVSPLLRITDHGVGLSAEEVRHLQGGFFRSLTRRSRLGTGQFGLGAKAPYAYVDQFIIHAIKAGREVVFQAYRNAEGVPSLSLVHEGATDKPNGVSVEIAIEEADIKRFVCAAMTVFSAFSVKPVFDNEDHRQALDTLLREHAKRVCESGRSWRLYRTSDPIHVPKIGARVAAANTDRAGNTIILGNVSYPCSLDTITEAAPELADELGIRLERFRNLELELDIATEAIEMDPGREALQYTERTCRMIIARLKGLVEEYRKRHAEKFAGLTPWEQSCLLNSSFELPRDWRRQALGIRGQETVRADDPRFLRAVSEYGSAVTLRQLRLGDSGEILATTERRRNAKELSVSPQDDLCTPSDRMLVVINDGGSGIREAVDEEIVARHGNQRGIYSALIVRPGPRVGDRDAFERAKRFFLDYLGTPPHVGTRELCKRHGVHPRSPDNNHGFANKLGYIERVGDTPKPLAWSESAERLSAIRSGQIRIPVAATYRGTPGPMSGETLTLTIDGTKALQLARLLSPVEKVAVVRSSDEKCLAKVKGAVPLASYIQQALGGLSARARRTVLWEAFRILRRRKLLTRGIHTANGLLNLSSEHDNKLWEEALRKQ